MKHIFVIDPKSFFDETWKMDIIYKDVEEYFDTQENPDYSIVISKYRRDAVFLIQTQVDKLKDGDSVRVYAIGGNEIIFDCLNGIAGLPNVEFAMMPIEEGTCDFLRSFGEGSAEYFKDIKSLIRAPVISTDVIDMGRLYAINTCIIGFDAAVPFKINELNKRLGREINDESFYFFNRIVSFFGNMVVALDKQIISQHYNISIDDNDYSGNYCLINIANGSYYNGDKITVTGAIPDDGLLNVALFKSAGLLHNMRFMKNYSRGKTPSSDCIRLQAKKISLQSDDLIWIQVDGEYFQDKKITFEAAPGMLRLAVVNNMTYQIF